MFGSGGPVLDLAWGGTPFGALVGGVLAELVGALAVLVASSVRGLRVADSV